MKTKLHFAILTLLSIVVFPVAIQGKTPKNTLNRFPGNVNNDGKDLSVAVYGEGIRDFVLVDADTDTDLFVMKDGGVIDIDIFGNRNLNIRVTQIEPGISVDFTLSGPVNRAWTENIAPYALFGDLAGNYNGVKLPAGKYHLQSDAVISGALLNSIEINFSVAEDTNEVVSFNLIDATNNVDLDRLNKEYHLKDGQLFESKNYPFTYANTPNNDVSIKATTNSYLTGSVILKLSGPISYSRTENVEPFTLFGDSNGEFNGQPLPNGMYTLTVTPYRKANGKGEKGIPRTIKFSLADLPDISLQETLTLINAESNAVIFYLSPYESTIIDNKDIITDNVNLAAIPRFNSDPVGSVFLSLEGPVSFSKTENFEPFALFGDLNGDYNGMALPVGTYRLTATPYSGPNRTGASGLFYIYDFQIINSTGTNAVKMILYPNPASNTVAIKKASNVPGYSGTVLDMAGNTVFEVPKNNRTEQFIDISGLKKGLYLVMIHLGTETITKKLVVQ